MTNKQMIAILEAEWEPEKGFFWSIRQGVFRSEDFTRTLEAIKSFGAYSDDTISRRVVSLLWYAPIFMQWQVERIRENDGDVGAYTVAMNAITAEVERVLGVP